MGLLQRSGCSSGETRRDVVPYMVLTPFNGSKRGKHVVYYSPPVGESVGTPCAYTLRLVHKVVPTVVAEEVVFWTTLWTKYDVSCATWCCVGTTTRWCIPLVRPLERINRYTPTSGYMHVLRVQREHVCYTKHPEMVTSAF